MEDSGSNQKDLLSSILDNAIPFWRNLPHTVIKSDDEYILGQNFHSNRFHDSHNPLGLGQTVGYINQTSPEDPHPHQYTFEQKVQLSVQSGEARRELDGTDTDLPLIAILPRVPLETLCSACPEVSMEYAANLQTKAIFLSSWLASKFKDTVMLYRQFEMKCNELKVTTRAYLSYNITKDSFNNAFSNFINLFEHVTDPYLKKLKFDFKKKRGKHIELCQLLDNSMGGLKTAQREKSGRRSRCLSYVCAFYIAYESSEEKVVEAIAQVGNRSDLCEMESHWKLLKAKLQNASAEREQTLPERFVQMLSETHGENAAIDFLNALHTRDAPFQIVDASAKLDAVLDTDVADAFVNKFHGSDLRCKRFSCNNAVCRRRMAVNFQVGSRRAPHDDKDTMWAVQMPLLQFLPPELVNTQAQLAFFNSNFYELRIKQTVSFLTLFRSRFNLESSHIRLSILACSAVFGFYFAYFAKCTAVLESPNNTQYTETLNKYHKTLSLVNGNALIDAVAISMLESWRFSSQPRDEHNNPVPPTTLYEKRDVVELAKYLVRTLGMANVNAKVFHDIKYLKEYTTLAMPDLLQAFSRGCLGLSGEHLREGNGDGSVKYQPTQIHGRIENNENFSIPNDTYVFLLPSSKAVEAAPTFQDFKNLEQRLEAFAYRQTQSVASILLPLRNWNVFSKLFMHIQNEEYIRYEAIPSPLGKERYKNDPGVEHIATPVGVRDTLDVTGAACGSQGDSYIHILRILHGTRTDCPNLIGRSMQISEDKRKEFTKRSEQEAYTRVASMRKVHLYLHNLTKLRKDITNVQESIKASTGRQSPSKRDSDGNPIESSADSMMLARRNELLDALGKLDCILASGIQFAVPVVATSTPRSAIAEQTVIQPPDYDSQIVELLKNVVFVAGTVVGMLDVMRHHSGHQSLLTCLQCFSTSEAFLNIRMCENAYSKSFNIRNTANVLSEEMQMAISFEECARVSARVVKAAEDMRVSANNRNVDRCVHRGIANALLNEDCKDESDSVMYLFMVDAVKTFYSYTDAEFDAGLKREASKVVGAITHVIKELAVFQSSLESIPISFVNAVFSRIGVFVVCAAAMFKGTDDQKRHAFKLLQQGCDLYRLTSAYSRMNRLGSADFKDFAGNKDERTLASDVANLVRKHIPHQSEMSDVGDTEQLAEQVLEQKREGLQEFQERIARAAYFEGEAVSGSQFVHLTPPGNDKN